MHKILAIFDGSNFYHKSKRLAPEVHLTRFNYRRLVELLANQTENLHVEYCVGEIRQARGNPKTAKMYSGQQALFYTLNEQKVSIELGFMLKNDGVYHEKGVDVKIATDILRGAFLDEYDTCFIISSDTDIIPAIRCAMDIRHKQVVYIGFENFVSRAMTTHCSRTRVITKEMLMDCAG